MEVESIVPFSVSREANPAAGDPTGDRADGMEGNADDVSGVSKVA